MHIANTGQFISGIDLRLGARAKQLNDASRTSITKMGQTLAFVAASANDNEKKHAAGLLDKAVEARARPCLNSNQRIWIQPRSPPRL